MNMMKPNEIIDGFQYDYSLLYIIPVPFFRFFS